MAIADDSTFDEWLPFGQAHGFCSAQFCETHEGPPMTDAEAFDHYGTGEQEPCIHLVRHGSPEDWWHGDA